MTKDIADTRVETWMQIGRAALEIENKVAVPGQPWTLSEPNDLCLL